MKSEILDKDVWAMGETTKILHISVNILSKKCNYKGLALLNIALLICSAWEHSQHLSAWDLCPSNMFI